jgi:hypothetical protein
MSPLTVTHQVRKLHWSSRARSVLLRLYLGVVAAVVLVRMIDALAR